MKKEESAPPPPRRRCEKGECSAAAAAAAATAAAAASHPPLSPPRRRPPSGSHADASATHWPTHIGSDTLAHHPAGCLHDCTPRLSSAIFRGQSELLARSAHSGVTQSSEEAVLVQAVAIWESWGATTRWWWRMTSRFPTPALFKFRVRWFPQLAYRRLWQAAAKAAVDDRALLAFYTKGLCQKTQRLRSWPARRGRAQ